VEGCGPRHPILKPLLRWNVGQMADVPSIAAAVRKGHAAGDGLPKFPMSPRPTAATRHALHQAGTARRAHGVE
jgi:hypothetical protein